METIKNPDRLSAWGVINSHIKTFTPLTPELIRAAYNEFKREEAAVLAEQHDECMELRDEWVEAAEVIRPTFHEDMSNRIQSALDKHAESSPKPLTHRFPVITRIPGIRRWFR